MRLLAAFAQMALMLVVTGALAEGPKKDGADKTPNPPSLDNRPTDGSVTGNWPTNFTSLKPSPGLPRDGFDPYKPDDAVFQSDETDSSPNVCKKLRDSLGNANLDSLRVQVTPTRPNLNNTRAGSSFEFGTYFSFTANFSRQQRSRPADTVKLEVETKLYNFHCQVEGKQPLADGGVHTVEPKIRLKEPITNRTKGLGATEHDAEGPVYGRVGHVVRMKDHDLKAELIKFVGEFTGARRYICEFLIGYKVSINGCEIKTGAIKRSFSGTITGSRSVAGDPNKINYDCGVPQAGGTIDPGAFDPPKEKSKKISYDDAVEEVASSDDDLIMRLKTPVYYTAAVQLPEVCVGTTYYLTESMVEESPPPDGAGDVVIAIADDEQKGEEKADEPLFDNEPDPANETAESPGDDKATGAKPEDTKTAKAQDGAKPPKELTDDELYRERGELWKKIKDLESGLKRVRSTAELSGADIDELKDEIAKKIEEATKTAERKKIGLGKQQEIERKARSVPGDCSPLGCSEKDYMYRKYGKPREKIDKELDQYKDELFDELIKKNGDEASKKEIVELRSKLDPLRKRYGQLEEEDEKRSLEAAKNANKLGAGTEQAEDGGPLIPDEDVVPDRDEELQGGPPKDSPNKAVPKKAEQPQEEQPHDQSSVDLGLIKAVADIVALAVVDIQTGDRINNVGVKLLPDEPPLPVGDVVEASSEGAETFDDTAFFEDDADGGFTDEEGVIELSSLSFPIGDEPPGTDANTKQKEPKDLEEMGLVELLQEEAQLQKARADYRELREQLENDKGFSKRLVELHSKESAELKRLKEKAESSAYGMGRAYYEERSKIVDKYAQQDDELEDEFLKSKPKEFAQRYREARRAIANQGPRAYRVYRRLREWDSKVVEKARADLRREQVGEAIKRASEAAIEAAKAVEKSESGTPSKESGGKGDSAAPKPGKKAAGQDDKPGTGPSESPKKAPAKKTRVAKHLSLEVDTEPKDPFVAAARSAAAVAQMMNDELIASVATNVFEIGAQPIVQFAVPRRQTDEVKERIESSDWVSWFKPDPCWYKQEARTTGEKF